MYVIDPGFVKQNNYNPRTGMASLTAVPVSYSPPSQPSSILTLFLLITVFSCICESTRRSSRTCRRWEVFPTLYQMGLLERTRRKHCPWNPTNESSNGRSITQISWNQQFDRVRVHGSTGKRNFDESTGAVVCFGCVEWSRGVDQAREEDGRVPCWPDVEQGDYW